MDVCEAVVGVIFDMFGDAVFLKRETAAGEKDIGLAGCREV